MIVDIVLLSILKCQLWQLRAWAPIMRRPYRFLFDYSGKSSLNSPNSHQAWWKCMYSGVIVNGRGKMTLQRPNSVWFNRSSRNSVHTFFITHFDVKSSWIIIKTRGCCILDIHGPISSKLDMYDKIHGLMTSTQKSWPAPPGGNRKCLVFCKSYTLMYYSSSIDYNHVKLCQKGLKTLMMKSFGNWVFVEHHISGVASNFYVSPWHTKLL